MYDGIIIHYNEIATKGKNRSFFENKLISNIIFRIDKKHKVFKKYGLVYISLENNYKLEEIKSILTKIPGIAYFSFVKKAKLDLEDIKKTSVSFLKEISFKTFKCESKRSNKNFLYKSPEINKILGEEIINSLDKTVDVKTPDLILFVEVCEKEAYVFSDKIKGIGGLPVGSSAKVICSLSGGIDSPVSAYLFMKRGSSVTFVHFYNNNLVKREVLEKIKKLTLILSKYQPNTKLFIVPFSDIQKNIIANIPSDYRMIIYRRYMFKIINKIAKQEKIKAVITGDNIGQVASQTIENIKTIYSSSNIPIFSPLIAFDKNEIIKISKEIETYETSIVPYPDCCSFMLSKHPKTKTDLDEILALEKNILDEDKMIKDTLLKTEIFKF